jgi:hypothetical protein
MNAYSLWLAAFRGIAPTVVIVAVVQHGLPPARWIRWATARPDGRRRRVGRIDRRELDIEYVRL